VSCGVGALRGQYITVASATEYGVTLCGVKAYEGRLAAPQVQRNSVIAGIHVAQNVPLATLVPLLDARLRMLCPSEARVACCGTGQCPKTCVGQEHLCNAKPNAGTSAASVDHPSQPLAGCVRANAGAAAPFGGTLYASAGGAATPIAAGAIATLAGMLCPPPLLKCSGTPLPIARYPSSLTWMGMYTCGSTLPPAAGGGDDGGCSWEARPGKLTGTIAEPGFNVSSPLSLDQAAMACPRDKRCMGITCTSTGSCWLRPSRDVQESSVGEVSYTPTSGCIAWFNCTQSGTCGAPREWHAATGGQLFTGDPQTILFSGGVALGAAQGQDDVRAVDAGASCTGLKSGVSPAAPLGPGAEPGSSAQGEMLWKSPGVFKLCYRASRGPWVHVGSTFVVRPPVALASELSSALSLYSTKPEANLTLATWGDAEERAFQRAVVKLLQGTLSIEAPQVVVKGIQNGTAGWLTVEFALRLAGYDALLGLTALEALQYESQALAPLFWKELGFTGASNHGWLLALVIDGSNTQLWKYDSPVWASSELFEDGLNRKTAAFNTPSNGLKADFEISGRAAGSIHAAHNLGLSLQQIFASGTYQATTVPVQNWRDGLGAGVVGWQAGCNRQGFNVDGIGNMGPIRFGNAMNQAAERNCGSSDSIFGIGLSSSAGASISAGAHCRCCQDGGQCKTTPVTAKVYIWADGVKSAAPSMGCKEAGLPLDTQGTRWCPAQ